jgi:hypothetical protein
MPQKTKDEKPVSQKDNGLTVGPATPVPSKGGSLDDYVKIMLAAIDKSKVNAAESALPQNDKKA